MKPQHSNQKILIIIAILCGIFLLCCGGCFGLGLALPNKTTPNDMISPVNFVPSQSASPSPTPSSTMKPSTPIQTPSASPERVSLYI